MKHVQNFKKAILTCFLILIVSLATKAQYSGGSGTAEDPYQISVAKDLDTLMNTPDDYDKHFILTNDIDLAGCSSWDVDNGRLYGGSGLCIGYRYSDGIPFSGVFDGNYHTISNLYVQGEGYDWGLFGYTSGATIKNLIVKEADVTGWSDAYSENYHTAILIGDAENTFVSRCGVSGSVEGEDMVGGLIGRAINCVINECYADSVNIVEKEQFEQHTAALVGNSGSKLAYYKWGYYAPLDDYTEIAYYVSDNTIINCFANGSVNGSYASGLVAVDKDSDENDFEVIRKSYYLGTNSSTEDIISNESYYTSCYYNSDNGTGTGGLSTEEFGDQNNFTDWDFDLVWEINTYSEFSSFARPYFKWMNPAYSSQMRDIIFNAKTVSGEAIPDLEITLANTTRTTNSSGQLTFTAFTDNYTWAIDDQYKVLIDTSGTIISGTDDVTVNIVLNKIEIKTLNPDFEYDSDQSYLEINETKYPIDESPLDYNTTVFYLKNGTYTYTFNHGEADVAPTPVTGIFTINNTDSVLDIPFTTTQFLVKSNTDTLLSDAMINIADFELSTDANGETSTLYLSPNSYTYTLIHPLIGVDTLKQNIVIPEISLQSYTIIPELYTTIFNISLADGTVFSNATVKVGSSSVKTDNNGNANFYLPPGTYDYSIKHTLFAVDSISGSITITNTTVYKNIILQTATFNLIANGAGIQNTSIVIGNKTLDTDTDGSTSTYLPNGTYSALLSHSAFLYDSLVFISVQDANVTTDIELHQANFSVYNSDASAYNGAILSICDTSCTIPSAGLGLYLPFGSHPFTVTHDGYLAGEASGTVTNETVATNHNFTVYNAIFNLRTTENSYVDNTNVLIDNITANTKYNTGSATIKLFNGSYTYYVANNTITGNLTIANNDTTINLDIFHDAYFYVSVPDGSTWSSAIIQINDQELSTHYRDSVAEISLPQGIYPFTIYDETSAVGLYNDTLRIPANSSDTITAIVNPFNIVVATPQKNILSESEVTIGNKLFTGENSITIWAFKGNCDYMVTHLSMIDTVYGSINIADNTYGSDYLNHIPTDTLTLAQLLILADSLPLAGAYFYKDLSSETSGVKIPTDGYLYFGNTASYNYEIYARTDGAVTGTMDITQGVADTIELYTLSFNSNNSNCCLTVDGDTLTKSIRRMNKILFTKEYGYKTFYQSDDYVVPIDSGTASPTNKTITQNIYVPTYSVVSSDGSTLTGASLRTNLGNNIFAEDDNTFGVVIKEGETVTSTISCAGYKDSTFRVHSDNSLHTIQLTQGTNTTYYTVTFTDWDGTTVLSTQTVSEGSTASVPTNPTRTGYTFVGWDVDFTNITSDLTIVAQYTAHKFTVTFVDYNSVVLKIDTVDCGNDATTPTEPIRTGYTFTGWDTDFTNITGNLTVTAQYSINKYLVTFNDYDGTLIQADSVEYGKVAIAPSDPTRTGYSFTGWNADFSSIFGNLSVTAIYTINKYLVTFNDYNGSLLKLDSVEYGNAATAPSEPVRTGYSFNGWDINFSNVTSDLIVTALYEQLSAIDGSQKRDWVTIFPNPTTGIINISLTDEIKNTELFVYSITGELKYYKPSYNGELIDLSGLKTGVYFIKIDNTIKRIVKK